MRQGGTGGGAGGQGQGGGGRGRRVRQGGMEVEVEDRMWGRCNGFVALHLAGVVLQLV